MSAIRTSLNSTAKKKLRRRLEARGKRCANPCCNRRENLTIDHIVPLSKGGSDHISNLQLLCRACNLAKGARHIDYGRLRRRLERRVTYDLPTRKEV
jgi:5-methylcytosine-specific restriction endonuclease McrA